MADLFVDETQGRRPVTWLIFAVSATIAALSIYRGEKWFISLPFAGMALLALWYIATNVRWGIRLTDSEVIRSRGARRDTVAYPDIDHVIIDEFNEGCDVWIVRKNGSKLGLETEVSGQRAAIVAILVDHAVPIRRG